MPSIKFDFNTKKGVALLEYILSLLENPYNYMSLLKLAFFADRYHLRTYARPVSFDFYYAMKLGPVPSNLKDIIDIQDFYSDNIFKVNRFDVKLNTSKIDKTQLSKSDIEAIEFSIKHFGKVGLNQYNLANLTHAYPEWNQYKEQFEKNSISRIEMDYRDFLSNAKPNHEEFQKLNFTDPFIPLSESERANLIQEMEEMHLMYG